MLAITESDDYLYNVCKLLYYKIAKDFNTTAQSVERCIRHSISTVFTNYISASDIEKIFKNGYNSQKGVPTNSQFLMSLAEYIKYNY